MTSKGDQTTCAAFHSHHYLNPLDARQEPRNSYEISDAQRYFKFENDDY